MKRVAHCAWCRKAVRLEFYRGKLAKRCACHTDYRTPVETRRDAVLDKYGDDPSAYTPAVLAKLAKDGLLDLAAAFCPAGKLSMVETKRREALAVIEAGTGATACGRDPKDESANSSTIIEGRPMTNNNITEENAGTLYAFNRRVVDDQMIYVRASSLADASRTARGEDLEDTGDAKIKKVTIRRITNQDTNNG